VSLCSSGVGFKVVEKYTYARSPQKTRPAMRLQKFF